MQLTWQRFNREINWRKSAELLIASLPGTILAYYFNDQFWFSASLIAVCTIIPIGTSHQNFWIALFHGSYMFALSILLYYNAWQPVLYLFILCSVAIAFAIIETDNPHFKDISTWTFISVIYVSIRFHGRYSFKIDDLIWLYLVILFSIIISIITFARYKPIKIHPIIIQRIKTIHYFKYLLPLIISILIWHRYNPPEVEWFIWASLSVLNVNFVEAKTKMNHRVWGGGLGIIIGIALMPFMPNWPELTYVFYILILISFRMFYKYLYCYTIRCFFIVLFSGVEFQSIGKTRLLSIIIGGFLGLLCSWLINRGDRYFQQHYLNNS